MVASLGPVQAGTCEWAAAESQSVWVDIQRSQTFRARRGQLDLLVGDCQRPVRLKLVIESDRDGPCEMVVAGTQKAKVGAHFGDGGASGFGVSAMIASNSSATSGPARLQYRCRPCA